MPVSLLEGYVYRLLNLVQADDRLYNCLADLSYKWLPTINYIKYLLDVTFTNCRIGLRNRLTFTFLISYYTD